MVKSKIQASTMLILHI